MMKSDTEAPARKFITRTTTISFTSRIRSFKKTLFPLHYKVHGCHSKCIDKDDSIKYHNNNNIIIQAMPTYTVRVAEPI